MSDELRIALIAEGPTDYAIIHAALQAVLPDRFTFVMTLLQPEDTQPRVGTGWPGVLKWCHAAQQRHSGPLQDDPTLFGFDLCIIHLDVDVAKENYAKCGLAVEAWAKDNPWKSLPCDQPCPPVSDTVEALADVLQSWLGTLDLGDRTLICLPAQSSGTWLAAAVLPAIDALLINAECNLTVESRLATLPKKQRIKKTKREYQAQAPHITEKWHQVKAICTQATIFERDVLASLGWP